MLVADELQAVQSLKDLLTKVLVCVVIITTHSGSKPFRVGGLTLIIITKPSLIVLINTIITTA